MKIRRILKFGLGAVLLATNGWVMAQDALHSRALPYRGTWGLRILHATAYDAQNPDGTGVNAENFDVDALMAQIDQLTTINHVMINLNRGHQASWYSAPYPEKSAEIGAGFFPTRDLFGDLLDALQARNIKALVYFSGVGYDPDYPTAAQNAQWATYLENNYPIANYNGTEPEERQRNEAIRDIVEYYSLKYGTRIDGWWFDRCYGSEMWVSERTSLATAARAGNPDSFFTMHVGTTGSPLKQRAPECDYTAGHPTLMAFFPPWTETTTRATGVGSDMVEDIEAGPWIDINGIPDDSEGTALGGILMPFQEKWRNGAADFPTELALEWTTRTMDAGGLHTWAVERVGSVFATPQFNQLLEMNAAIEHGTEPKEVFAHWALNENFGTVAADHSGNGYDGTITNGTWVSGVPGSALDFDGVSSSVTLPPEAFNVVVSNDAITVSAWVKGSNGAVLRANDAFGRVLSIVFNSNGNLYWDAGNSGTSSYDRIFKAVDPVLHTGEWSHWVFTKSASSGMMAIYRNGELWHSGTGNTRTMDGITEGSIGSALANTYFNGSIDEVQIYNISLFASEILDLYMTSRPIPDILYSATPANSTLIRNTTKATGTPTLMGETPDLLYSNPGGAANNGGFSSADSISTLLGRSLTVEDTVTISLTIDSVTTDTLVYGGITFGMAGATTFQPAGSLLVASRVSGGTTETQIGGPSFVDASVGLGFDAAASGFEDGFGMTLVANSEGYTFSFTKMTADAGTIADFSGVFSNSTDFIDYFGAGHFYVTAQIDGSPSPSVLDVISATIRVTQETETPVIGDVSMGAISGGSEFALSWLTDSGKTYGVAVSTNLVSNHWKNIVTNIPGTGADISLTNLVLEDAAFYRVYLED